MEYVTFGRTGLKVSRLCLGCMTYGSPSWRPWVLDLAASRPIFARALELGINYFDTADSYSLGASEEVTGKLLQEMAPRHQVVISTKVNGVMGPGPNERGLSRKHIMEAIDASLRRLKTDYVDLYLVHRLDPDTPFEEWLEAFHDVVKAGKALYFGVSSMAAWQFSKAIHTARAEGWTVPVSMQPQYNLVYREEEREMFPLCRDQGIAITPYSPLARGFLAGPSDGTRAATDELIAMGAYSSPEDTAIRDAVAAIAESRGVPMAQVALAWVLHNPQITSLLVGAESASQLDNAHAALSLQLTDGEIGRLEASYRPKPVFIPVRSSKTGEIVVGHGAKQT